MEKSLTNFAKALRKSTTDAETLLWGKIKAKQLQGIKFRRQQPVGNYIVDFISFEKRLVVELDGGQHAKNKQKDQKRDLFLSEKGFKVLRFWNNDVLTNIEGVLAVIRKKCSE